MNADDVCRLAQALARNCNYPVFPCGDDKRPMLKRWPERASTDPAEIERMWREHPGPLVGIVTGKASGVSVLDVDRKHVDPVLWWQGHHAALLPTRTYATRSGGLHLYFRHLDGVTNSQNRICRCVDTRGEGGYVISWFAAGAACLDHSASAPWPKWLRAALEPPPRPAPKPGAVPAEAAIGGILRRVAAAQEGERNAVVFWAACRLSERGMRQGEIEGLLIPAAFAAGLADPEIRRTITSAQGRAVA